MKGTTKIVINRETLKAILENYIGEIVAVPSKLKEFTIHRTGSIELSLVPVEPAALPLEQTGQE
jgi:hypothetical protein